MVEFPVGKEEDRVAEVIGTLSCPDWVGFGTDQAVELFTGEETPPVPGTVLVPVPVCWGGTPVLVTDPPGEVLVRSPVGCPKLPV